MQIQHRCRFQLLVNWRRTGDAPRYSLNNFGSGCYVNRLRQNIGEQYGTDDNVVYFEILLGQVISGNDPSQPMR